MTHFLFQNELVGVHQQQRIARFHAGQIRFQTKAVEASEETFEELVVKAEKPVIVDFYAEWAPFYDAFRIENKNKNDLLMQRTSLAGAVPAVCSIPCWRKPLPSTLTFLL